MFFLMDTRSGFEAANHCAMIVEETLTSGEYISLFLISILNIYIYKKIKELHYNRHIF